jgi:hypothetical protein
MYLDQLALQMLKWFVQSVAKQLGLAMRLKTIKNIEFVKNVEQVFDKKTWQ